MCLIKWKKMLNHKILMIASGAYWLMNNNKEYYYQMLNNF